MAGYESISELLEECNRRVQTLTNPTPCEKHGTTELVACTNCLHIQCGACAKKVSGWIRSCFCDYDSRGGYD